MSDSSTLDAKPKRNAGMVIGIIIMLLAVGTPLLFWGITYWRDLTNTYCSGECATGWYAVISTFLALPSLIIGLLVYVVSFAARTRKLEKGD